MPDYRVIAIDMAGRGDSDYFEKPEHYSYVTYMADCVAFMDNFHMRHVSWIGTSMGGIIGMMIAAMHPRRIKRMVLNDIGAFIPKTGLTDIMSYVGEASHSFSSHEDAERQLQKMVTSFGLKTEEEWQHLYRYSLDEKDDGNFSLRFDPNIMEPIRIETNNYTDIHDIDLSDLWEGISIPTLILRGADSTLLRRETVSAMCSSNIRASSFEFQGVGHAPTLSNDEQISTVTRWFRSGAAGNIRIQGV